MFNQAIVVGRLGRDPEMRTLDNGSTFTTFSLATSKVWNDKLSGERKEITQWHNISIWNEQAAKYASQYLRKGSKVQVVGQIQYRKWTDNDGNQRNSTDIVIDRYEGQLVNLTDRDEFDKIDKSIPEYSKNDLSEDTANKAPVGDMDDEIPF